MFILLATLEGREAIREITLSLLDRYWPDHPSVRIVSPPETSPWLGVVAEELRSRTEDLFIVLLDDYGLCGPAKVEQIARAAEWMRQDQSIGLFPLCAYPSQARRTRGAGIVSLIAAPILLQAAIWRREWFVELADQIDQAASPWAFEREATRLARRSSRQICSMDLPESDCAGGQLADSRDKSNWLLAYHNLMHRGKPNLRHENFLWSHGLRFPSRGLGDTVAQIAHATGLDRVAQGWEKVIGRECGCGGRRERLNRFVEY